MSAQLINWKPFWLSWVELSWHPCKLSNLLDHLSLSFRSRHRCHPINVQQFKLYLDSPKRPTYNLEQRRYIFSYCSLQIKNTSSVAADEVMEVSLSLYICYIYLIYLCMPYIVMRRAARKGCMAGSNQQPMIKRKKGRGRKEGPILSSLRKADSLTAPWFAR
jgi:hypothetical protein